MKKIHMIAALLAMLLPTVLWAGGDSTTYYAALKAQVSSNSSGMGKVYAGTSNSAPSASSYNASSSQTSAQESETQNSTKDLYAFALPNDGYEFVGWSRSNNGTDLGKGTAVGDAYCITAKVTFNSESSPNAQTWYATFKEKVLDAFSITFETSANGTYTVDGSAPANKTGLTKATSVVLASSDSNFLNWNINGTVVNNNPYTLSCTENTTVSADFLTADQVTSVTTLSDLTSALSNAAYKKIIVPSGTSITVAKGSTVTVPAGKQLVIDGMLVVVGTMSNSGVISGSGTLFKISYLIDQGELQILYQADGTECSTISGTAHHAGESAHYYKTQVAVNTPSVSGGTISVSSKWGVLLNGETPYEISAQSVNGVRVNIDKTVAANKITSITGSLTSTDIQSGETGNSANWVLFSNCNLKGPARSGETNRLNFNGTIDLCGYTLTFGLARTYSDFYGVFLNGKINFTPSTDFQNGGSIFFNCSSINITKIKGTPTMLFYDCGTAASPATLSFSYQSSAHRNARFYCGYYSYSFNSSYDSGYAKVYGGAYTSNPSDYLADKDTLTVTQETLSSKNYYVVNKVYEPAETCVKIGSTEYNTLKKAIAAAQNGDTIECIAAVDLTGSEVEIPSGLSITIALNDHGISGGKIVNRGTVVFTDAATGKGKENTDASGGTVGSNIDNYGTLDFVFGSYSGAIVNKTGGTLTTHNGMFTGTFTKEAGTVNLKGGHFSANVTALATVAGCEVFNRNNLYSVCEVPNGTMYDTTVKGKAGYGATPYVTADHTLLKTRYNNDKSGRSDYSANDWKRLAELMAFYQLFNNNGLDPTLVFDRAVAQDSVNLAAATGSNEIDSKLHLTVSAGTPYRALTEHLIRTINPFTGKTSYAKTYHAIIEENLTSVAIAVTDKSGNNAGTLCKAMVELWDSYKTNSTLKATNTVYDAGHKFFVLNAGSNKAMIRPETGAATFYATPELAMSAVADGGTVMLANDCDTALPLTKAGTYTFDTMGFAYTGGEPTLGERLFIKSSETVDSAAKVLVPDAVATTYVVAQTVATVGSQSYDNFADAFAAALTSGEVLTLLANCDYAINLTKGQSLKLAIASGVTYDAATKITTTVENFVVGVTAASGYTLYKVVYDGDPVQIGTDTYGDLGAALSAAKSGDTVTIIADTELSADGTVPYGATLVIGADATLTVAAGKALWIDGDATINGTISGTYSKCTKLFYQEGENGEPFCPYKDDDRHNKDDEFVIKYWKTKEKTFSNNLSGAASHTTIQNGLGEAVFHGANASAFVCSVNKSVAVNHITGVLSSQTSALNAYNAIENMKPQMVLLTANGSVSVGSSVNIAKSVAVDCASAYSISFSGKQLCDPDRTWAQNPVTLTLINSTSATAPKVTTSRVVFINCSNTTVGQLNANGASYMTSVHVYDSKMPSISFASGAQTMTNVGAGVCVFSGGAFSVATSANYHYYGGYYSTDPSARLYDSNYVKAEKGDPNKGENANYWYIKPVLPTVYVAQVGSEQFETVQEAVNAAGNNGGTVELLLALATDGLAEPITVAAGKTVTIDLKGLTINAPNGAFINNGTLFLKDTPSGTTPGSVTTGTTTGKNLIVNNGTMDVTYGTYNGNILLNDGTFTTHGGTFTGTLTAASGKDPKEVANLRGGSFSKSVTAFLRDGYVQHDSYVGEYPFATPANTTLSDAAKAWKLTIINSDDSAIYNKKNEGSWTEADWKRYAELSSRYISYGEYTPEGIVMFDRAVSGGTISLYADANGYGLPSQTPPSLNSNEAHPFVIAASLDSPLGKAYTYKQYLSEVNNLSVGVGSTSANDGTVCTLQLQFWQKYTTTEYHRTSGLEPLVSVRYMLGGKKAAIDRGASRLAYDSLAEAVAAVQSGERILIGADSSENVTLPGAGTFSVDPYGFAFTGSVSIPGTCFLKSQEEVESSATAQGVTSAKAVTYVVALKVAQVGETFFDNLTEAVANANGAVVTLLAATDETITLTAEGQTFTLNKNGIAFDDAKVVTTIANGSVTVSAGESGTVYTAVTSIVDASDGHKYNSVTAAVAGVPGNDISVTVTANDTEEVTLPQGKTLTVTTAPGVTAELTVTPGDGAFIVESAVEGGTKYESKKITVEMAEPQATVAVTKIDNGTESTVTDTTEISAAIAKLENNHDVPRTDNTDKLDVLDKITVTPTKIVEEVVGSKMIIRSATFDVVPALNAGQSLAEGQKLKFRLPVDAAATQLSAIVYHGTAQFGIFAVQTYNNEKFIEVESDTFSPYGYELLDGETANPIAAIGTTGYATLSDAIAAASNGDTITVFAGTFDIGSDTITVNKQVTITGAGKDDTVLTSSVSGKGAFSIAADNVTIQNLTISLSDTADMTRAINVGNKPQANVVDDVTLRDVKFVGGRNALSVYASDLTIDSCEFSEQYRDAILLYTVQGTSAITDNTFVQTTPGGQAFIYGTVTDNTDPLSFGSLTISGNTATAGRGLYHCNNQNRIDTTTKLTLTITDNEIIGYNNKAIVFAGHNDIPLGNIFNSITITENAFYTTKKRPTIQRDDTDTSSLAINASGNYWGAATPDFENLIPGTTDKYLIVPPTDNNVIVDSYYQAYDEDTDTLSNLYTVPRVAQNTTTGVKYESLAAAVAAASAGDTITMLADDTVSLSDGSRLTIDKSLTITGPVDTNGEPLYTIYGKSDATGTNNIYIDGSGTVTLSNLKIKDFGNNKGTDGSHAPVYVASSFTGTVNLDNLYISDFNRGGVFLYGGTFNVTDCYIDCANSRSGAFTKGIEIKGTATGTIADTVICNMERSSTTYSTAGIEVYGNGTITVDGCTILSNVDPHQSVKGTYGIVSSRVGEHDPSGGSLHVTDCYIDVSNAALSVADDDEYGPVNNYSIVVDGEDTYFSNYIATWSAGSSITVTEGEFNEDVYADAGTINITGGTFNNFAPDTNTGTIAISGGVFDSEVPEEYCAEGYIPAVYDEDTGLYTVKTGAYVAQIGTTKYESLAEAVAAASAGDTITMLADITITAQQTVSGLTIDLNGKSITTDSGVMAFRFEGNSTLTDSVGTGSLNTRCIDNYGSLAIDGVTYNENGSGGASAIRNFGSSLAISNSTLTVNSQFGVTSRQGADDVTIYNTTIQPTAAQKGFVAINSESRTDTIIEDSTINAWFGYRAYRQGSDASPTATAEGSTVVVKGSTVNIDNSLTGDANGSAAFATFVDDVTITIQDTDITIATHDVENAAGSYAFGSHRFTDGEACDDLTLTIDQDSSITLSGSHSSILTAQPSEPDLLSGEDIDFEVQGNALRTQFENAGYVMQGVQGKDGWYTVNEAVAQIGTTRYGTFAEAIAAADAAVAGGGADPVIIVLDTTAEQSNADWIFSTDSSVVPPVTTLVRRTYYNVWVGGTRIAADNAADVFGDGKVSYDASTKTLTLNGYTYSGAGYENSAIYATEDIAIVVQGENSLTSTAGNCIYAGGTISVTGDGATPTLNIAAKSTSYAMQVAGASAAFTNVTMAVSGNRGIVVNENNNPSDSIDIKGCDITFASGTDRALQVWNGEGDSLLTIADSTVTGVGRIVMFAEGDTGDTTCFITNSTVALTDSQIESYNGDATVEISESTVSMTGGASNKNGAFNVGARYGADTTASVKILNNSDVTCSGQYSGINVWTWGENGPQASEIIVEDSTLTSSGSYYGLSAYSIYEGDTSVYFTNSTVNATGAISAIEMCSDPSYNAIGDKTYTQIDSAVTLTTTQYAYGLDLDNSTSGGVNGDASNTATIIGGSLTCNGCGLYVVGDDDNNSGITMHDANVTIDVTGRDWYPIVTGELSVDSGTYTIIDPDENGIAVDVGNISGGNFNEKVPEELCADGYIPTELDPVTGRYTVKQGAFVARNVNTGVGYETLYSAVAAATAGDMVTLLTNVTESLTISKDLTLTGDWTITGSTRFDAGATVTISNLTFDANGVIYAMNIAGGSTVDLQNATVGGGQWCNIHLNNGTLTGSGVTMKGDQIVVAADGQTYTYRGETYQASEAPWGLDVTKVPGKTLNVPYMDIVREGDTDTITLSDSEQKQLTPAGSILFVSNMPEDETLTGVTLPARFSSYTLTLDADIQFFGGADKPVTGWAVGNWNEIIDTGAVVLQALDENPVEVPVELELNNDVDLGDGDSAFEFRYPNLTVDGNGNTVSGTIKYTDNAGIVSNIVMGTSAKPLVLDMTGVSEPVVLGGGVEVGNVSITMTPEQATAGTPVIIWNAEGGVDAPENEAGVTITLVDAGGEPTGNTAGLIWDDEMGLAYIGPCEARLTGPTHETPIYTTLANAIARAAQSGDTVTLMTNIVNFTGTQAIDKSLVIDGAGYSIKAAPVPADGHRDVVNAWAGSTAMFKLETGDVTFRNITLDGDATHAYTFLISADNSSITLTTENVRLLNGGELAGDANGAIVEQGAGYGAAVHLNNGAHMVVSNGFYACTGGTTAGCFPFTGILVDTNGGDVKFELTGNPNDPANVDIGGDLLLVGMPGVVDLSQTQTLLDYMKVPSRFIPYTLTLGDGSAYAFTGASPLGWNDIIDYGKEIMDVSTAIGYNGLDKDTTPVEVGLLTDTVLPDTFTFEDPNFTVNGNGNALAGTIEYTDNAGQIHDIVMGTEDKGLVLDMTGTTKPIALGSGISVSNVTVQMTAEQATAGTPVIIWDVAHGVDAPENEAGVTVQIVDDHGDSTGDTKELIWDDELGVAYIGPCEARLTGPTHDKPIYTTLARAIELAEQTGDTVTLMMNVTNVTATYEISKQDLVIDGAGYTVAAAPVTEHRNMFEAWGGSKNMFKLQTGDITFRNITLDGDETHAYTFLISADNSSVMLTTENVRLIHGGEISVDSDNATVTPGNGYGAAIHLNNGAHLIVSNGFYACTGTNVNGVTTGVFPFTAILPENLEAGTSVAFELTGDPNDPANVDIGDDLLLVGMIGDLIDQYGIDAVQGILDYMKVPTRFIPYTLTLADGSAYAFTGASPRRWNEIIDYGKDIMDVATANGFDGLNKNTTPVEVGLATDTVLPAGADGDGYDFLYEDSNFSVNGNGNALSGTIKFTDDAKGGLMHDIGLGTETNPLTLDLSDTDNPVMLGVDVIISNVVVKLTEDQATLGKIVFEWDSGETPPDDEQGVEVTVVNNSGTPTGETKGLIWDEEYGVAYIGPVEARLTGTTHETPVYTSLANALDIAKDNDKVELLTNAVLSAVQGVGSDVTLDLEGYKVEVSGGQGLLVTNATLNIVDSGVSSTGMVYAADGAAPTSLIESGNGGVVNIPTGIFVGAAGQDVLVTSGNGAFAVSGGYFSKQVLPEYCAENYMPVDAEAGAPQPYTVAEFVSDFRYPIDGSVGVPIERTWLAQNFSDIYSDPTKPVLANVTNALVEALSENGANEMPRWESYVLGLDPTDVTARLRLTATSKDAATVTIIGLIDMTKFPKPEGTTITFRLAEVNPDGTKKEDLVKDSEEPSFDVLLEEVIGKELAIFADIAVEGVAN